MILAAIFSSVAVMVVGDASLMRISEAPASPTAVTPHSAVVDAKGINSITRKSFHSTLDNSTRDSECRDEFDYEPSGELFSDVKGASVFDDGQSDRSLMMKVLAQKNMKPSETSLAQRIITDLVAVRGGVRPGGSQ